MEWKKVVEQMFPAGHEVRRKAICCRVRAAAASTRSR